MKTVLSIAGSDPSGGAGIQADIKTLTVNGVYAMAAVTALTAQNTTGVFGIHEVPPAFLKAQLEAVFEDIPPDAVKIGMVHSTPLIRVIAEELRKYQAKNIVMDPVMVSTSGKSLLNGRAKNALANELFPLATLITPNIPEAEALTKKKICSREDREGIASCLANLYGCAVLIKGGHAEESADDLLFFDNECYWIEGERISNPNTHGTGCTLSSAIAANLAKGYPILESVRRAKEYISGALRANLDLGKGSGPMDHAFDVNSRYINYKNKI